jgi:hypothetical protein
MRDIAAALRETEGSEGSLTLEDAQVGACASFVEQQMKQMGDW